MENLVQISNNLVVTSSFQVAEHFHKEHRNVLRTIREYINQLKNEQIDNWFYETNYIDDKNREYPMYLMNRDGFSLLVMGFTGSEALSWKIKYINAFNSMEAQLKKQLSKKKKLGITSAIRTNLINGKFKVRDFPKWHSIHFSYPHFKTFSCAKIRDFIDSIHFVFHLLFRRKGQYYAISGTILSSKIFLSKTFIKRIPLQQQSVKCI